MSDDLYAKGMALALQQPVASAPISTQRQPRQRYLFLLSHMRSYSSLLAHVLGSSSDIDGYGETHTLYEHKFDLWRLRRRVRRSTGTPLQGRWLLDKILQNSVMPPDRFVTADDARAIVFLRRPESAIRSIVTMLSKRARPSQFPIATAESACDYYVSRLHRLRIDGERFGQRAIYFDAETLIDRPVQMLAALSVWLELQTPLTPDYRVLQRTGEFGFGDPSQNIHSGRILDSSATTIEYDVRVPKPVLLEAEAAYRRCRLALIEHCHFVPDGLARQDVDWRALAEADATSLMTA